MKRLLFSNQEDLENTNPLFTLNQIITLLCGAPVLRNVPVEVSYKGNSYYDFSVDGFTYSMKEYQREREE